MTAVQVHVTPDLADMQGDILRAYGNAYQRTSYLFVHLADRDQGRRWLSTLVDLVTSAQPWEDGKPPTTLNVAFTYRGLHALGVSSTVLETFSNEFRQGMTARAPVVGDIGRSAPERWDPGLSSSRAHVLVVVNALSQELLEDRLGTLRKGIRQHTTLEVVHEEHANLLDGAAREHFGYADGFAQPAVEEITDEKARGGGVLEAGAWRSLALGEFVLGYEDEASRNDPQHAPPKAPAEPLGRNGTYAVWRKLEQDVALFRRALREAATIYPDGDEEKLAAKVVGRWRNGTPLVLSPDQPEADFQANAVGANDFRYSDSDPHGLRCPVGAHIRRCNPRDLLGYGTLLTFRHRMIRRGMPYGPPLPDRATEPDGQQRGLVFVCYVASISRQFESVQIQWLEDGNSFGLGRDKDFLMRAPADGEGKMTVPGTPPFFLGPQRDFVTMRGGAYLFVPGRTALGALADGVAG